MLCHSICDHTCKSNLNEIHTLNAQTNLKSNVTVVCVHVDCKKKNNSNKLLSSMIVKTNIFILFLVKYCRQNSFCKEMTCQVISRLPSTQEKSIEILPF